MNKTLQHDSPFLLHRSMTLIIPSYQKNHFHFKKDLITSAKWEQCFCAKSLSKPNTSSFICSAAQKGHPERITWQRSQGEENALISIRACLSNLPVQLQQCHPQLPWTRLTWIRCSHIEQEPAFGRCTLVNDMIAVTQRK
jgi:hypothetical protein